MEITRRRLFGLTGAGLATTAVTPVAEPKDQRRVQIPELIHRAAETAGLIMPGEQLAHDDYRHGSYVTQLYGTEVGIRFDRPHALGSAAAIRALHERLVQDFECLRGKPRPRLRPAVFGV
jgi:hypothetical protein